MSLTRREMCLLFPAVLLPASTLGEDTADQENALPSAMYPFDKLPIRTPNNVQIRDVLKGKLATGESVEVHETTLPPGGAAASSTPSRALGNVAHPRGAVELTVNGTSYHLGPGSVGFVHSNDEHGIRNVSAAPATYFVVAIGSDAKATP